MLDRTHPQLRSTARRRPLVAAAPAVAAAIAVLLLLAPASLGSNPRVVTIVAPYKGSTAGTYTFINSGGCGAASISKLPYWSPTKGIAGFVTQTSATKCAKRTGGIGAYSNEAAGGEFTVSVPLKNLPSGNHTIAANWTLTVQATEAATVSGACPLPVIPAGSSYGHSYCGISVGVFLNSYAYMVDVTNGQGIRLLNYWGYHANTTYMYNQTQFYSGSNHFNNYSVGGAGGFSGSFTFAWIWNATSGYGTYGSEPLNSSHKYAIVMDFSGDSYAYVTADPFGYPVSHVASTLNLGTFGNGWKLNFISVT